MFYDKVQQSLEEYATVNWTETAIQFDNVPFNTEIYTEFLRHSVRFGEGRQRSVTIGCYRQLGVLMLTVFTKPSQASNRRLELARAAADLYISKIISASPPLTAPKIKFMVPDLNIDSKEVMGWVQATVMCPFYYDFNQE